LTARIQEAGAPILGLRDVQVVTSAPRQGVGSWLAAARVSQKELARIKEQRGTEWLAPFQRKAYYLSEIKHEKLPLPRARTLRMYDDGSNGDLKANDGIYTARFPDSGKAGVYAFRVRASGGTHGGNRFDRDRVIQTYVRVGLARHRTPVRVARTQVAAGQRFVITITPMDALGNYLGPGNASAIHIKLPKGELTGGLHDNLDGSYEQAVTVDRSVSGKDVQVAVTIAGTASVLDLASEHPQLIEPPTKPPRY